MVLICVRRSRLHKGPARYRDGKAEIRERQVKGTKLTAWVPDSATNSGAAGTGGGWIGLRSIVLESHDSSFTG